jgi:hypothetical protein
MQRIRIVFCLAALLGSSGAALAQAPPPTPPPLTPTPKPVTRIASPIGHTSVEVGGKYVASDKPGVPPSYTGGKWIDVTYYRPIKRDRTDLFGAGADYGKKLNASAPVWRAGANVTTRLKTEVPLEIGGKRLEPGEYSLFVDLKENAWTLIVSTQPWQKNYDANDKVGTWGAYFYDPKHDVVRAPMKLEKMGHSLEEFMIDFVDVNDRDGKLALWWDKEFATADFKILN